MAIPLGPRVCTLTKTSQIMLRGKCSKAQHGAPQVYILVILRKSLLEMVFTQWIGGWDEEGS